jgi:hypothetical protein
MTRSLCLLVAVLAATASVARAENNMQMGPPHNALEERACKGDAHRFCREVLSDEFQVASCLQEHRDRISHACRTVLDGHGM